MSKIPRYTSPTPDDNRSEFSYAESEGFNKPFDKDVTSQYSDELGSSHYSFQPPKRGSKDLARDSYLSSFSEYSGNSNQVAQPVSVKVVNEPVVPTINRTASKKLQTEQVKSQKLQPDMSYNTNVENSIPPRSSRRPKSEVVDTSNLAKDIANYKSHRLPGQKSGQVPGHLPVGLPGQKAGHNKRVSLAISDDLDKLMERANSIKSKTFTFTDIPTDDSSIESKKRSVIDEERRESKESVGLHIGGAPGSKEFGKESSGESKDTRRGSSESYKTASVHSGESERPLALPKKTSLPPRPSSENLIRSRQVSNQNDKRQSQISYDSSNSRDRIYQTLPQPPVTSDDESHYSDEALLDNNPAARASMISQRSLRSQKSIGLGISKDQYLPGEPLSPESQRNTQPESQRDIQSESQRDTQAGTYREGLRYKEKELPEKPSQPESVYSDRSLTGAGDGAAPVGSGSTGSGIGAGIGAVTGVAVGAVTGAGLVATRSINTPDINSRPSDLETPPLPPQSFPTPEVYAQERQSPILDKQSGQASIIPPHSYEVQDPNYPHESYQQPYSYQNRYSYSPKGEFSDFVKPKQVFDDENTSSQFEEPGYPTKHFEGESEDSPVHPNFGDIRPPEASGTLKGSSEMSARDLDLHHQLSQKDLQNQLQKPRPSNLNLKTPDSTLNTGVPVAPVHNPQPSGDVNLDDEEFYDIEDPVLVEKPSRGKSVKDSTKHPKKLKRKASKKKKRDSTNQLKPFSYHTLINLLESINGTIIGEEFNQLNLPVKEKQLIEKIVDQLSRLTSDMVLDDQRYNIGIDRLERALRVLEGFM